VGGVDPGDAREGLDTASCHLQPDDGAICRIQLGESNLKKRLVDSVAMSKTVPVLVA
jgi:hypothetical protein